MANTLSGWGLQALHAVWTDTAGTAAISGRVKLRRPTSGPAGVLLKQVASLQEAVSVGGIYLYDIANPAKWYFLVGDSLKQAIINKTIGQYPGWVTVNGNRAYDLIVRERWRGGLIGYKAQGGVVIPTRSRSFFGGDCFRRAELQNFFTSTQTVGVMGVVTGATEGMGHSTVTGTVTHSYMATCVPMNTTFENFMRGIKATMVAEAEPKIRTYYERSFDSTMNVYPGKSSKPTIAITTIWEGNVEVPCTRWKPTVIVSPKGAGWTSSTSGSSIPHYGEIRSGLRDASTLPYPQDCVYDDLLIPNQTKSMAMEAWSEDTPTPSKPLVSTSTKARVMERPGYPGSKQGSWTGPVLMGQPGIPRDLLGLQTGVVSGLNVGLLRDAHVFARSLVDGQRYALDAPNHSDLAKLVIETLDDQLSAPADRQQSQLEQSLAEIEAEAAQINLNEDPRLNSIYQRGTLAIEISKFSSAWDDAAKALAKSEN